MAERLVLFADAAWRKPNARVRYPAGASSQIRHTNLPAQLTRFVGREHELAKCWSLLGTTRLLTLTGPGGVRQIAISARGGSPRHGIFRAGGIWLVELAFLTQPEQIAAEIAGVLGLKMRANRSARDLICDFIQDRHMLLILDNCEHLVTACAELAQWCLQRCRRLRILSTSREVLHVPGETVHRVQPLALPPATISAHAQDISAYEYYTTAPSCCSSIAHAPHSMILTSPLTIRRPSRRCAVGWMASRLPHRPC